MVDGVHGYVGHAAGHVVVEHNDGLESVTIPHLYVEEVIVVAVESAWVHAIPIAVLVRL